MAPAQPARRFLAFGLAALALTLAGLVAHRASRLAGAEREAARRLEAAGVLQPVPLEREPDPGRVELVAARALLAAELDPARQAVFPQAARESAERLAGVARRAETVLAGRPASADAALVVGMATYAGWSQARDPRLFTSYRSWEAPLEAARELAPGSREPDRLLAVAYLEVWQLLSPRKKEVARGLLRTLLADPEDRNRFLEPWLATASDRREAFAVIPPVAAAWDAVAQAYARRADWPGFAAARRRWDGALLAELRRDLGRAARCKEDGDPACARDLYLGVATRTRTEPRFLPLLDQALTECPPGPVGRERAAKLAPQLAAAVDRCLLAECSLSPGALERLARFVRDAPAHQQALALLFAGEPAEASAVERRANVQWSAEWGPYLIVKARALAARGRSEEAREALAQLHRDWEDHPLAWQARRELAVQTGAAGEAAQAVARLEAAARAAWPETAWTVRRGAQRLEMLAAVPATGLVVELAVVEDRGAVVELHLDGALAGTFVVAPGSAPLTLAQPVASGFHVLELHIVTGGLVLPGSVRLR